MKLLRMATLAAAATAVSLLAIPSSPASAGVPSDPANITLVSGYAYGLKGQVVKARAQCPPGMSVVSTDMGNNAGINSLVPTADFTAVEGTGVVQYDAPDNWIWLAANCAPNSLFTGVTSATTQVGGAAWPTIRSSVAWCPAGYFAFAGGGYFSNAQGSTSFNAYRMVNNGPSATFNGQGWTYGSSTFLAGDVMVIRTRCAPTAAHGNYIKQANVKLTASATYAIVDCGPGYFAISGGVYIAKADGSGRETYGTVTYSESLGGPLWYVAGFADSQTPATAKLVATAQCIRVGS